MRNRIPALVCSVAVAASAAFWLSSATAAQTAGQRTKPSAVARTPDGHPDLQGIYNVETITPVERPIGVKSLVLSDQEAAALEAYEQQRNAKSLEPSAAD